MKLFPFGLVDGPLGALAKHGSQMWNPLSFDYLTGKIGGGMTERSLKAMK